ncbi:TrmB family transcriptional regulator [Caulobacter sp. 17J80-11]|uniref:TrmB family transcriptional regulator n=1 Tax=Caulobacter sp. 17J80-11 TaxID=2763502 RepID=UPI00165398CA|nr:TrmB family transcriptional regulator [Caulobacter sp. 17J80-11]MBC6981281.1 TrmB family transcriptional regulator [Caulobacter sp. 17J80-11]
MSPEESLSALGFTDTEALVYCELLRAGAATGYRLAQAIGKAQANTYKALSTLVQKGAVLADEGEPKSFRALPPAELVGALQKGFSDRAKSAQAALESLGAPAPEDRIYQLRNAAQVYERARAMIAGAREVVLFDLFPGPFAELAPALAQAHARGVTVAGVWYQAAEPAPPFEVSRSRTSDLVIQRWPGEQLTVVADSREYLVSLLSQGAVRHAIWSDSLYLSCLQHYALAAEVRLHALAKDEPAFLPEMTLAGRLPPGLRELLCVEE